MYHLQESICKLILHVKGPIREMKQKFQTLKRVLWPDPYLRILIRLPRGFFDFWTTRGLVLFHAPWHMSIVTTSLFSRMATPQLHTTLQQGHRRACTYRAPHGSKESDVVCREWKGGEVRWEVRGVARGVLGCPWHFGWQAVGLEKSNLCYVELNSLPPLLIRKNVTFSKTLRGCRHDNLASTLGVTQCDSPPLKNPSYALGSDVNG